MLTTCTVEYASHDTVYPASSLVPYNASIIIHSEIIIIIMVHLRMQPEGYGAAIYTFELQSLIASSSPQFLLLRCCEVLLFCRLVSVLLSPSDGCFLVSSGLRGANLPS